MPELSELLKISYVSDDDTDMYTIGEIEGIPKDDIEKYVNVYGSDRLEKVLVDMLYYVRLYEEKINESKRILGEVSEEQDDNSV